MTRQLRSLARASAHDSIPWELARRLLRTEGRYRVLKDPLAKLLARRSLRFLPEAAEPEFEERQGVETTVRTRDPLGPYWRDLRRLRPTTRGEEFALARAIDLLREVVCRILGARPSKVAMAIAQEHLSPYSTVWDRLRETGVKAIDRPLRVEKRDLLQQRLGELRTLQGALVDRNLHLVPTTARKYKHVGVPFEDLVQEGNTALLRAVEKYDRNEGTRFTSYAGWWVHQGILKALSFQSRAVRLPVYLAQILNRVRNAQARHPHPVEPESLAREVRASLSKVRRALRADRMCFSMDQSSFDDGDESRLRDQLPDRREPVAFDEPQQDELRESLDNCLNRLPSREAYILRLRFGWEDGRPWTLDEVGGSLGISRERVRQLHSQALRRLSRPGNLQALARFA